jgi:hypothetical protein
MREEFGMIVVLSLARRLAETAVVGVDAALAVLIKSMGALILRIFSIGRSKAKEQRANKREPLTGERDQSLGSNLHSSMVKITLLVRKLASLPTAIFTPSLKGNLGCW